MESIRMEDLLSGKGEWTNMQPVLRRALAAIVEELSQQRQELRNHSKEMADVRISCERTGDKADRADVERLREEVFACTARTENVVDMKFLESCLAQKADKAAVLPLMRNNEIGQLRAQCNALAVRVELLEGTLKRTQEALAAAPLSRAEMNDKFVQRQFNQLWEAVNAKADIAALEVKLAEKADKSRVERLLAEKAGKAELDLLVLELERSFAVHEESLQSLRDDLFDLEQRAMTMESAKENVPNNSGGAEGRWNPPTSSSHARNHASRLQRSKPRNVFTSSRVLGHTHATTSAAAPSQPPAFASTLPSSADPHAMLRTINALQDSAAAAREEYQELREKCFRRLDRMEALLQSRAECANVERLWTAHAELQGEVDGIKDGKIPLHGIESKQEAMKLALDKMKGTVQQQVELLNSQLQRKADGSQLNILAEDLKVAQRMVRSLQLHINTQMSPAPSLSLYTPVHEHMSPAGRVTFSRQPEHIPPFQLSQAEAGDQDLNTTIPPTSPPVTLRSSTPSSWSTSLNDDYPDGREAPQPAIHHQASISTTSNGRSHASPPGRRRSQMSAKILHELQTLDHELTLSLQKSRR